MNGYKVPLQDVEDFLLGYDEDDEYIVNIEYDHSTGEISKIYDHPEKGKYIESDTFKPFAWMNANTDGYRKLYNGKVTEQLRQLREHGLEYQPLETGNHSRLMNGYPHLIQATEWGLPASAIRNFFSKGGSPIQRGSDTLYGLPPVEQFLIQKGKRLFKGVEEATDIHKLCFDLETTGLDPNTDRIFFIGIKDNRGYEKVIECWDDDQERNAIIQFFNEIDKIKPTVIFGYNSENFDWYFIQIRCLQLGLDLEHVAKSRHTYKSIYRKEQTIKFGNEVENYLQTHMWGYHITDTWHAVRRAQAIDSNLKFAGLKYVCQYNKIAKENRVYVPGGQIYRMANENKDYLFNKKNGKYKLYNTEGLDADGWVAKRPDTYEKVNGKYIVRRYLLDDLWETMEVDNIYNQTPFLLTKTVPSNYARISTMGTAGYWKLLMAAWSYIHKIAIPESEEKRDFVGGLSRLFMIGYAEDLGKLDYDSLYPAIMLVHDIFPTCDITGVMKSLLKYFHSERFKYKNLANEAKKAGDKKMAAFYKRKQLPLKIFINSMYGALNAPHAFPWGEIDKGEQVTCTGRQYLRLLVKFFEERGFKACVLDTDGVNFTKPPNSEDLRYTAHGVYGNYQKGQTFKGMDAIIAEFNELYMIDEMGLSLDGEWPSTVNFARKNYALLETDGSISLTGNSIKSKSMSEYIEDFINKGVKMLLENKGFDFVEYYNEYVEQIFNQQIPLRKIASKSKVKSTVEAYDNRGVNKNGDPLPKQAHMELIKLNNIRANLGDTIYYVNNGNSKSHGAVSPRYKRDKFGKLLKFRIDDDGNFMKDEDDNYIIAKPGEPSEKIEDGIHCYMLNAEDIENNPDLLGEYNVPKMVDSFNSRISSLLVAFDRKSRHNILRHVQPNLELKENVKEIKRLEKLVERLKKKMQTEIDKMSIKRIEARDTYDALYKELVANIDNAKEKKRIQKKMQSLETKTNKLEDKYAEKFEQIQNELKEAQISLFDKNEKELPEFVLTDKHLFMAEELNLVAGQPELDTDQDDIVNDFYIPEDREIIFWQEKFGYNPNIFLDDVEFTLPNYEMRHLN